MQSSIAIWDPQNIQVVGVMQGMKHILRSFMNPCWSRYG